MSPDVKAALLTVAAIWVTVLIAVVLRQAGML